MTAPAEGSVPEIVLRAVDAAERHDTDAFLACFASDGAVDDWGRRFTGPSGIRRWSDAEFIGKRVVLADREYRTHGDTTELRTQVGGDGFNGPSTFAFTVRDGRVTLMKITG